MSNISRWSNSAGGNTASSPDSLPENCPPSGVNDAFREAQASVRRWYEDAEWIDRGNTPTFQTTASFTIAGDHRTPYHIGRRIKCSDASILYGKINDVTYSANTRVSVTLDSGQLSASLSAVAVGILSFNNFSRPDIQVTTASYAIAGTPGFNISGKEVPVLASETATSISTNSSPQLDLGTVTAGDRILAIGFSQDGYSSAPTYGTQSIAKASGTATITGEVTAALSPLTASTNISGNSCAYIKVTGSGTLVLQLTLSYTGGTLVNYSRTISVVFLKKQ